MTTLNAATNRSTTSPGNLVGQNADLSQEPPPISPSDMGNVNNYNNLNNNSNNINQHQPPSYPCGDMCVRCGKKIPEALEETDPTVPQPSNDAVDCPCECHKHHRNLTASEPGARTPQAHIPPGGPNCLPGCGYSGLPCYNCSSFQDHLRPPEGVPTARNQSGQRSYSSSYAPHIYTVELLQAPSSSNSQSPDRQVIVQNEDHPEALKRRRTCVMLVGFVITINVFIAVIRMLGFSKY